MSSLSSYYLLVTFCLICIVQYLRLLKDFILTVSLNASFWFSFHANDGKMSMASEAFRAIGQVSSLVYCKKKKKKKFQMYHLMAGNTSKKRRTYKEKSSGYPQLRIFGILTGQVNSGLTGYSSHRWMPPTAFDVTLV